MKTQRPYRRSVEIYFVLYLAALLLLIPDEREGQDVEGRPGLVSALLQTSFSIVPEKNYITARLRHGENGTVVLSVDSLNTITAVGNVRDVRYEFYIDDQSLGETLRLTSTAPSPTPLFSVLHDPVNESATFVWRPLDNEQHSRTFTVRVVARAKPVVPPALRSDAELRRQLEEIIASEETALTARTQFEVAVTFGGEAIAAAQEGRGRIDTVVTMVPSAQYPPPTVITSGGEPVFDLEFKRLDAIAGDQWTNEARLYNLDLKNGVAAPPRVVILGENHNGRAYIDRVDLNTNTVYIKGLAPTSDVMRVQLIARRASDDQQVTAEFTVRPSPVAQPGIPESMYPERSYPFDPRLPILSGQSVSAVLYEGQKERVTSSEGQAFTFTPKESDIGKTFRLERFINGKRVGEAYTVAVIDYPLPRVFSVYAEPARIVVRTQGFGPEGDIGKRVLLTVSDAVNCRPPREVYGDYEYDRRTGAHLQVFELIKIDPSKPASCTVTAVDQKRRTSEPYTFGPK